MQDYQILDAARAIVFVDSFMGYEAFARGNKIAAFSVRGKIIKTCNANFADNQLPNDGFFWTNKNSQRKLSTIMNRVLAASNSDWNVIKKKLENKIILYDKDNNEFKKLIKKILSNKI